MRYHVNIMTLIFGVFLTCMYMGAIPIPLVGIAVIVFEFYRSRKIARLTTHIPVDTIRAFYRSDRSHRYFGAKATAKLIEEFSLSHANATNSPGRCAIQLGRQAP
jgi:hypothetical protein